MKGFLQEVASEKAWEEGRISPADPGKAGGQRSQQSRREPCTRSSQLALSSRSPCFSSPRALPPFLGHISWAFLPSGFQVGLARSSTSRRLQGGRRKRSEYLFLCWLAGRPQVGSGCIPPAKASAAVRPHLMWESHPHPPGLRLGWFPTAPSLHAFSDLF